MRGLNLWIAVGLTDVTLQLKGIDARACIIHCKLWNMIPFLHDAHPRLHVEDFLPSESGSDRDNSVRQSQSLGY